MPPDICAFEGGGVRSDMGPPFDETGIMPPGMPPIFPKQAIAAALGSEPGDGMPGIPLPMSCKLGIPFEGGGPRSGIPWPALDMLPGEVRPRLGADMERPGRAPSFPILAIAAALGSDPSGGRPGSPFVRSMLGILRLRPGGESRDPLAFPRSLPIIAAMAFGSPIPGIDPLSPPRLGLGPVPPNPGSKLGIPGSFPSPPSFGIMSPGEVPPGSAGRPGKPPGSPGGRGPPVLGAVPPSAGSPGRLGKPGSPGSPSPGPVPAAPGNGKPGNLGKPGSVGRSPVAAFLRASRGEGISPGDGCVRGRLGITVWSDLKRVPARFLSESEHVVPSVRL